MCLLFSISKVFCTEAFADIFYDLEKVYTFFIDFCNMCVILDIEQANKKRKAH